MMGAKAVLQYLLLWVPGTAVQAPGIGTQSTGRELYPHMTCCSNLVHARASMHRMLA